MADDNKMPRIVDDTSLHAVYVDTLVSAENDPSAINVTMGAVRYHYDRLGDEPKPPNVHVAARLALSKKAAIELVNGLTMLLRRMGAIPEPPSGAPQASKH